MTPSQLKYMYEENNPHGYYFTRKAMKFFGDTMANYGVRKAEVNGLDAWELYRKKPVKAGLKDSVFFCAKTFKQLRKGQ